MISVRHARIGGMPCLHGFNIKVKEVLARSTRTLCTRRRTTSSGKSSSTALLPATPTKRTHSKGEKRALLPILVSQVSVSGNAGYKKEFFLELSNNETSSFKRSSSSRDEEPVTSCTSLPAMPYASLPSLVQAGMFQIFGTWLYHIHIYYICRSVDQQGDSDSKYIFPFDPCNV